MKNIFLLLFTLMTISGYAQVNGTTFKVCNTTPTAVKYTPVNYLEASKSITYDPREAREYVDGQYVPSNIEILCTSEENDKKLIPCRSNPLLEATYLAYAQHRPLILSPDMIWLTITQGFAVHVNENAEELRDLFVDFEGKKNLNIDRNYYAPQSKAYWESTFPEFSDLIAKNTKDEVRSLVVSKFSTTGSIEKNAYEITLMDGMKSYFQYSISVSCGIPEITLEGTPEDWELIEKKTQTLRKYGLGWWVDDLAPVLKEFTNAAKGKVDKKHWANIYEKKFIPMGCTSEPYITGWIVNLFPYANSDGGYYKNPLLGKKQHTGDTPNAMLDNSDFPKGLSMAPVLLNNNGSFTKLDFMAGFLGIQQDEKTLALRPEIGWVIRDRHEAPTDEEMKLYKESMKPKNLEAKN